MTKKTTRDLVGNVWGLFLIRVSTIMSHIPDVKVYNLSRINYQGWGKNKNVNEAIKEAWDALKGDLGSVVKYLISECELNVTEEAIRGKIRRMKKAGHLLNFTQQRGVEPSVFC
jgi:hypothetical protein